ncbi:MAG: hypothetical protein ACKOHK_15055, partial [Planctomycetia bacterium]
MIGSHWFFAAGFSRVFRFVLSRSQFARGPHRSDWEQTFGGIAVTIATSSRGHQDVLNADVFSWSELPDLLAAEDLFDATAGSRLDRLAVVAARDDDDDDDDDEEEEYEDED